MRAISRAAALTFALGTAALPPVGCGGGSPAAELANAEPLPPGPEHPVRIALPPNPGTARAAPILPSGRPSAIPCAQCHDKLKPPEVAPAADRLEKVHRGLAMAHGELSCFACHDSADGYRRLRLADGTPVEYEDVMTLCSQCHGPQRADYDHGAHGGMTGYWDLSRGPRERNACTVCHDPHAPAFPDMRPTFKPIDRFLARSAETGGDGAGGTDAH